MSFSTDEELMEALSFVNDGVFKVYIVLNGRFQMSPITALSVIIKSFQPVGFSLGPYAVLFIYTYGIHFNGRDVPSPPPHPRTMAVYKMACEMVDKWELHVYCRQSNSFLILKNCFVNRGYRHYIRNLFICLLISFYINI